MRAGELLMSATAARERGPLTDADAAALEAAEVESELEAAVEPWLEHMRWRADFQEWREGCIWQERRQKGTLNNLRAFLKAAAESKRPDVNGGARASEGAEDVEAIAGRLVLDLGCGMGGLSTALALEGARVRPV